MSTIDLEPHPVFTDLRTRLVVGMEVHVELATRTKMFTAAPNVAHRDFDDAEPNTLCDPVVIGMPGTLPVINRLAVEMSMRVGLALNCSIARFTKWDRKSYYYPDLPKNYQISQYDLPLCFDGVLEVPLCDDSGGGAPTKAIRIIRAHLEEDAGKLLHEAPGGAPIDHSIVDLNRAGTPLLEIVTQPDFSTADEAVRFGQLLRDICRHLGVTQGVMQKGHMRFEPNINVVIERDGEVVKTPIVEIKNLNSFKSLRGAIEFEYHRQIEHWLDTGEVMRPGSKSTRGWNDVKMTTFLQREKEEEHDYRYFPDPDLVLVTVSDEWLQRVQESLPELPHEKKRRYVGDYGLKPVDADTLVDEPGTAAFYEAVLDERVPPAEAAKLLLNAGAKRANERGCAIHELGITPKQVAQIVELSRADKIGSSAADELFGLCCDPANHDADAAALAEQHGLLQQSDTGALEQYVDQVLADPRNEKAVEDIRGGKDKAIGALMGQIMKLSKGQANPKVVREIIIGKVRG